MPLPIVIALALLLLAVPVSADDSDLASFCRALVPHIPDSDVTFRQGVDVRGRSVAPAEVDGIPQLSLPREVTIYLSLPLTDLIGETGSVVLQGAEADLGQVTVDRQTGEIRYNGQRLNPKLTAGLVQSCLRVRPRQAN